jgi:phosphonate transport system permease protein
MSQQKTTKKQPGGKPGLVNPALSGFGSLLVPGLGHMLAGELRKGFMLLVSLISSAALVIWRISETGRRAEGNWFAKAQLAFDLEPLLLVMAIGVIFLYLWIAVDAFFTAKQSGRQVAIITWLLVFIVFFGLGWQIGEINVVKMVTEARDAAPLLGRILWPWDRAIHQEEYYTSAVAIIQTPCFGDPPAPSQETPGEPLLLADPTCGDLTEQVNGTRIPGTTISVFATGLKPNTEAEIWWRDDQRNEFRQYEGGEYVSAIADDRGELHIDITMPFRLIPASESRDYALWELEVRQLTGHGPAELSQELLLSIEKMIETIFLGMMATFFGIILAVPISFLAARNLMSASPATLVIYYLTRTILNIVRSIEPLILAVIAIVVVGLGPFAGIVALTLHSIASLAKLYSEAIESIDPGPIEAIQATGANWLQSIMFAVLPQVIPPFVSFTIYRWDINVRMSTVIGLVGGGGIGYLLIQWIHLFDYKAAGIAVWFITMTVAILDYTSSEIRKRFI